MISNHGILKMYCRDDLSKIENYEQAINDKENKWVIHHRLEFTLDGEFAHTKQDLIRMGMYWKRPYFELIFMKDIDHRKLHGKIVNNYRTEETINKIRQKSIGHSFTEETLKKISETVKQRWKEGVYNLKCHTPEHNKAISEARKGKPHPCPNRKPRKPASEFGKKFKEHYGVGPTNNRKLWGVEYRYYRKTGKISWETKEKNK